MNQLTRRDFLKLCGASSVSLALAACGVTPTPTATPAPTNTPLPTSTPLPTTTATLTNTPAPTLTPTPTSTSIPSVTPSPKPTPIPAESADFHRKDISGLPDGLLDRRPNSLWVGDYAYGLNRNVAPDTIIERLPSYEHFDGSVLHVKIGNSPPPDTSDLQRAYVLGSDYPTDK